MNFKKIIYLCLLLNSLQFVWAQKLSSDFKVTNSTPYPVIDGNSKEYVAYNGAAFSVKRDGDDFFLQKFNINSMKEEKSTKYEDFPPESRPVELMVMNGKVLYFSEAYDKKAKNWNFYVREVDQATGTFKAQKSLFTTQRNLANTSFHYVSYLNIPNFNIYSSFDGSKILVQYRYAPIVRSDKINKDEIGFTVFDKDLNKIWSKDVFMPYTEKEMDNMSYGLNKDGLVCMLAFIKGTKGFELITISKEGLKNQKLALKPNIMFERFEMRENPNGNITAVGYYFNGIEIKVNFAGGMNQTVNIDGAYVFEFDMDAKIIRDKQYPFPIELIKKYMNERQQNNAEKREDSGKAGVNDLRLINVEMMDDGSMVILGEVMVIRKELNLSNVIHLSELVIMKIGPKGELLWADKLPKNQTATIKDNNVNLHNFKFFNSYVRIMGLGTTYIRGKDAHYVLFQDNKKNATLPLDKYPAAHKGGTSGYLTAIKVDDKTGKVERHLVCDLDDVNGIEAHQFNVARIFDAGPNSFLLEIYIKGKKDIMVKMDLLK